MDLFQLLIQLPFIDPKKLVSKVLQPWSWDLNTLVSNQQPGASGQMPGMPGAEGQMPPVGPDGQPLPVGPDGQPMMPDPNAAPQLAPPGVPLNGVSPDVAAQVMKMMGTPGVKFAGQSNFDQAKMPINLPASGAMPPTVPGVKATAGGGPGPSKKIKGNARGHNRTGKVNTKSTNINQNSNPESALLNRSFNTQ